MYHPLLQLNSQKNWASKCKPKISFMVAKKNVKNKIKIKIHAIICKVKEMKPCLRATVCVSKVNLVTCDRGSVRKGDDGM